MGPIDAEDAGLALFHDADGAVSLEVIDRCTQRMLIARIPVPRSYLSKRARRKSKVRAPRAAPSESRARNRDPRRSGASRANPPHRGTMRWKGRSGPELEHCAAPLGGRHRAQEGAGEAAGGHRKAEGGGVAPVASRSAKGWRLAVSSQPREGEKTGRREMIVAGRKWPLPSANTYRPCRSASFSRGVANLGVFALRVLEASQVGSSANSILTSGHSGAFRVLPAGR